MGEALKTNSFSGRAAHEIQSSNTAGDPVLHDPEDRGKAGAVYQKSRQRLYPKADTNTRCADLFHSHYGRKRYLEGTVVNLRGLDKYSIFVVCKKSKSTRYHAKKFEIPMVVTLVAQGFALKLTTVIWKGLLGHFQRRIDTPSASAFVQQRQKLLPAAFEDLFRRFTAFLRP